jgi:hypothetical protein
MAQAIRAVLLAMATVVTLASLRCRSDLTQAPVGEGYQGHSATVAILARPDQTLIVSIALKPRTNFTIED